MRRHGAKKEWIVLYYDAAGQRRLHVLCKGSLTKGQADEKRIEFMRTINGGRLEDDNSMRHVLLSEFVNQVYFPFQRGKWKASTAITSENRIQHHVVKDLGNTAITSFTLKQLQQYLDLKATAGLSYSIVNHLRWDINSIFEMAVAEKVITVDPSTKLYTPRSAKEGSRPVMTADEVETALMTVPPRERLILHLAIFAGFRPGEILALQRRHIGPDAKSIHVEQRIYVGKLDRPKNGKKRLVGIPPRTGAFLREWLDAAVGPEPDAWLFAGETGRRPLWLGHILTRHIQAPLKHVGLDWVDFRVMRRTNASLGHDADVDPKVSADQRGHGIGVSLDVYTSTSVEKKLEAMKKLEESVLRRAAETPERAL